MLQGSHERGPTNRRLGYSAIRSPASPSARGRRAAKRWPPLRGVAQNRAASLDHLVGAGEDRLRNVQPECSRSFEIEAQLERGRLLDWEIRCLLAAENPAGINTELPVDGREAGPVAHQAAGCRYFAKTVDSRKGVLHRQG